MPCKKIQTMEIDYLVKGVLVGFSIAAPVGPVGILTVERSLRHGPGAGLCTGMGAAVADTVYGCVAGFGLTVISGVLLAYKTPILWTGSLFLCLLGVAFLLRAPAVDSPAVDGACFTSYPAAFLSSFILTLTNPMTIMAFTAVFAGMGLGVTGENYPAAVLLVAGVFAGSCVWWVAWPLVRAGLNTAWAIPL